MPRASHSPGMWLYHDNQTPQRHLIAIMTFLSGLCMNTLFKEITLITRNFHLMFKYLNWMVYQDEVPSLQCLTGGETGLLIWAEEHQGLITNMQMHSLLFRMAVLQISQLIQIFNPHFGNSNPWRTHPTNNFSEEKFKIKIIKDGTVTFWLLKHWDLLVQGSERSNSSSSWLYKLSWATELEQPHLCKAPSIPPRVPNDLQWVFAVADPNAPAKLVSLMCPPASLGYGDLCSSRSCLYSWFSTSTVVQEQSDLQCWSVK